MKLNSISLKKSLIFSYSFSKLQIKSHYFCSYFWKLCQLLQWESIETEQEYNYGFFLKSKTRGIIIVKYIPQIYLYMKFTRKPKITVESLLASHFTPGSLCLETTSCWWTSQCPQLMYFFNSTWEQFLSSGYPLNKKKTVKQNYYWNKTRNYWNKTQNYWIKKQNWSPKKNW